MGRCYEFGVSIDDRCEHVMSVVAEGGACECVRCHAHCPGRFAGCAQVTSQPGYVPVMAPSWARSDDAPDAPPALAPPRPAPGVALRSQTAGGRDRPLGDVEADLSAIRELVEKLLDRSAGDDVEGLRRSLESRDAELTAVFERLTAAHQELAARVDASRVVHEQVMELLTRIDRRLDALEEAAGSRGGVMDWLRKRP